MFKHAEANSPDTNSGAAGAGAQVPATSTPSIADAPPAAPAAEPFAQPDLSNPAGKSWLETLPEDIRQDPSLQLFKTPDALAKSWVNAQKLIGADKVVLPGEKATEEEVGAFYQKLGRPDSPEKYDFKLPEGKKMDEDFAKGFKETAFKSGLNPKQVQTMVDWYDKAADATVAAQQAQQDIELRGMLDGYKAKLGGEEKFNATVDRAKVAVRAIATPEMIKFMAESGAGSRPEVIDFFAKIADMMGEDKIRDGTTVPFSNQDPAAIQKEITELETKMYSDLNSSNMSTWVEQRNSLYNRLSGLRNSNA